MLETYVLHITKQCNMKCIYCYEKDKTSEYEWDDIKVILDNIIKYNTHFKLEFLGGEPCLRIDLIKQTIEYLESIDQISVDSYYITTNGTIVTDELIGLINKYKNKLYWSASLDGTKLMNSMRIMKTGDNSYDTVVKNIKKLLNSTSNRNISVHFVTHHYNIGYLNLGIDNLYKLGVRNFGIGTIESTMIIDDYYCNEFVKQLNFLSDRIKIKNEFPNINVDVLNNLKPKSDQRHYIRDSSGKTLLETYGRANNDIKDSEDYKTSPSSSPIGDLIYNIREKVYKYHNFK